MCGYHPFDGKNDLEIFQAIKKGKLSFSGKNWEKISLEAKDLISKMLAVNIEDRITLENALEHKWFMKNELLAEFEISKRVVESSALEFIKKLNILATRNRIKSDYNPNAIKNFVYNIALWFLEQNVISKIRPIFQFFDKQGCGKLSSNDISEGLRELGLDGLDYENLKNIILFILIAVEEKITDKENVVITYRNFLIFYSLQEQMFNDDILNKVFLYLDVDKIGYFTSNTLKKSIVRRRKMFEGLDLSHVIEQMDLDHDQKVNREEFINFMKKNEFEKFGSFNDVFEGFSPDHTMNKIINYKFSAFQNDFLNNKK